MPRPFPVFDDNDTLLFHGEPQDGATRWVRSWPNADAAKLSGPQQWENTLNPRYLDAALLRIPDGRWCRCSWENIRGQRLWIGRVVTAREAADLLDEREFTLPPEWRELLAADLQREGMAKLAPSRSKAYGQWQDAIRRNAALHDATDREVYDWLNENLDDGEQLPTFPTWRRYVSEGRKAYSTSKHTSRAGRTGRSVVNRNKV
jgi:hypothetical protein